MEQREKNKMVAHDDDFPRFATLLREQFLQRTEYFTILSQKYEVDGRYFQTSLLLYDTDLITESTYWELENLALRFPCCGTNEQGFVALYFASIKKVWKPLQNIGGENLMYFDYFRRDGTKQYVIYKGG